MGCKSCCGGCFRKQAKTFTELADAGLIAEGTYYFVKVSMREGNPAFKAILYTSFAGGHATLHYSDDAFEVNEHVRIKIISLIGSL